MAATLAQRLASVESAIEAIEGGAQSISFQGRTYTRANLETLYRERDRVEKRIDRQSTQSRTVVEF